MDLLFNSSLGDGIADIDSEFTNMNILRDATTFSIVFSPSGKLIIHYVHIRNRDGETNNDSQDDIFNTKANVEFYQIAMFHQDDYQNIGFTQEQSRSNFIIYETKILKQTNINSRWTDYLQRLSQKPVYINPYTGTIVDEK
jgi:hypothetical protein